jgi:heme/copper-type cytochrome/quinol oxidase subunit 2
MSYVMYLSVSNNLNTLVSMITPGLLFVLTYGTLAIVVVVIVLLLFAIVRYGKHNIR